MPVINVHVDGQGKDQNGHTFKLPPQIGLIQRGPVVQVTVSLDQTMAAQILQSGGALPPPVTGYALIDTGASVTCIDDAAAQKLGLPVIDVANIASASHASTQQNVYPMHMEITGADIGIGSPRTVGAPLAAQGLLVLIGRDVLAHCMLVYNGATGSFTLSI